MKDALETRTLNGLTATLYVDPDPESPRLWDNLGTMVYWHRRYTLGDIDGSKSYGTPAEFEAQAKADGWLILPVYLYDHSVQRVSTTPFVGRAQHAEWDSGQIGYIYVTPEAARRQYPGGGVVYDGKHATPRLTAKRRQRALDQLKTEVETYDQYVSGQVYGYEITNAAGEHLDSCWGFFGFDYAMQEMQSALETIADEQDDTSVLQTPNQMKLGPVDTPTTPATAGVYADDYELSN